MIHVTRPDGQRIHITANSVVDVEPIAGGSLICLESGERLKVIQDARTVEVRLKVALAPKPAVAEEPIVEPESASPDEAPPVGEMIRRLSLSERAKRGLLGRSSLGALVLGRRW